MSNILPKNIPLNYVITNVCVADADNWISLYPCWISIADADADYDKGSPFQASTSADPPYNSLLAQLQATTIAGVMEHWTFSGRGYFVL